MNWLNWITVYMLIGIAMAEAGFHGTRNEPQCFGAATYLVCVVFWPLVLLLTLTNTARRK